ncbi:MAG: hypothetical protein M3Y07_09360 [Acidobacteriota bacterium]|nr:hypothetical protein [Acidobacteriota bacterium]
MSFHRNCALIVLNFALAAVGCASSIPRVSFEELVDGSETIVSGRAVRSWQAWDRSHQFIWTHCEFEVRDVGKGSAAKRLIVSEPGGTVDGTTMVIPGTIQFPEGKDLLLFLYKTPIGYLRTVGEEQGEYVGLQAGELRQRVTAYLHRKRGYSK